MVIESEDQATQVMEQDEHQTASEDLPTSLWMIKIKATELFPKEKAEREEDNLQISFTECPGESVKYIGKYNEHGKLAISNYRLYLSNSAKSFETSIPLRLIENVAIKEMFQIVISCKDACTYVCSFSTNELCNEWHARISAAAGVPEQLENLFAFPFHAWVSELESLDHEWSNRLQHATSYDEYFQLELERLKFDLKGAWRVSNINSEFKLCVSYPKQLIVPACISDETLTSVATFRSSKRIPVVTYRHPSGAVIARSSQPEVGWLGWRNNKDEQLLKALADACSFDNGKISKEGDSDHSFDTSQTENIELDKPKKILIVDARSYASAVTNRARGGGVECIEYYPSAEIEFMNLGNIHVIRKSFQSLRQLCALDADIPNWFSLLEKTNWLQHISGLLSASNIVCHAIEKNNRPVLIHCSDGWDRTSQISSMSQIMLDPFYRTMEGFKILIEKEWLAFGHKFGDRVGHGVGSDDTNERCPIFLQWIDCIHQIHNQFPCSFEFSTSYLIKLAQHVHSCLFGTFLCNTLKERIENSVGDRTFSVWPFLSTSIYKNPLYQPNRDKVLWPSHSIRDLRFWKELYGGFSFSFHTPNAANGNHEISNDAIYTENGLTKTRSFGDLVSELKSKDSVRRLSDPSIVFAESNSISLHSRGIFQESCDSTNNCINDQLIEECENSNSNQIHVLSTNVDTSDRKNSKSTLKEDVHDEDNENIFHVRKNDDSNDDDDEERVRIKEDSRDEIDGHKMNSEELTDTLEGLEQQQLQYQLQHHLRKIKLSHFQNGHSKVKKESTSSNDSQFSTPALRSTTPANFEKTIFLMDGLSHALSQDNLRLQQLVHEHKLKEEALQNEIHTMRLALLKTTSCQCSRYHSNNGKSHSANASDDPHQEYNSENSVCSWEAVDEKTAPHGGGNHLPWIPDFARTKCKNCQIEFWLGRRRHHCRLCMDIFCGDCSDNFAQLPNNENFQPPVRLCETCFKSISEKKTA